ncbi:uncharacterized protein N7477_003019 [Penicillium maclennaniae]|uniref:uncharacterized protein n=1 Tax=Penicillium maclennaniae TaxID=1343394 RepID=UPI00253FD214|nr:uncharacterized protein N7477_003019 [Penicillium maclennaniae]KAJ5677386.1 hypothetical protein N7477_003019 [Penicillium maclennaniae]
MPISVHLGTLALFNSTYYGKDYRAGAALLRARQPFLVKNALTGFGLFAFTIGVCTYFLPFSPILISLFSFIMCRVLRQSQLQPGGTTKAHPNYGETLRTALQNHSADHYLPSPSTDVYTIKAVGQEEFSDVKVPDAPAQKK